MNSLSVSFKYTNEDIFNFVIEALALEKGKCFMILICVIMLLIASASMLFIKAYLAGVFMIAFALLFTPLIIFFMYMNVKTSLQSLTNCVFTLEDDKLTTISNLGSTTTELKNVYKIIISKPLIFVYLDKKTAFFIPIRAFSSQEASEIFVGELQKRFKAAVYAL